LLKCELWRYAGGNLQRLSYYTTRVLIFQQLARRCIEFFQKFESTEQDSCSRGKSFTSRVPFFSTGYLHLDDVQHGDGVKVGMPAVEIGSKVKTTKFCRVKAACN
jgi:hypothetical protein